MIQYLKDFLELKQDSPKFWLIMLQSNIYKERSYRSLDKYYEHKKDPYKGLVSRPKP